MIDGNKATMMMIVRKVENGFAAGLSHALWSYGCVQMKFDALGALIRFGVGIYEVSVNYQFSPSNASIFTVCNS